MKTILDVWPPLPPRAFVRRSRSDLPFPFGETACSLFARGRHALYHGVKALGLRPGDSVLVPAFHHGSEIEALVAAGLVPVFYGGDPQLRPEEGELETLRGPRVRALLLTHYLGFPQDAARWSSWCKRHGIVLVEDAAQAWLAMHDGRPVGSWGQLSIFCLYKMFGLPDGAAAHVRDAGVSVYEPTHHPAGFVALAARQLAWWTARSSLLATGESRLRREQSYAAEEDFALGATTHGPARATELLLPRIVDANAASIRRDNYRALLDRLGSLTPEPFNRLPEGAAPFAFPIEVPDKDAMLLRLKQDGVRALDFWSVPHTALGKDVFTAVDRRRARTVALPVHQELSAGDLDRIVRAVQPRRRSRTPGVRLERSSFEELEDEWRTLAERSGNVFATWDWLVTWWIHFGRGRESSILVWRSRTGEARAIYPTYRWRSSPLSVTRFIGHGPSDELGPICAREDRSEAFARLPVALAASPWRWHVFVGEQLRGSDLIPGADFLTDEPNPVLVANGLTWAEFLATRSRNFRDQLRGRERRLSAAHDVRFRLAEDRGRLSSDLDAFFGLHSARWGHASALIGFEEFHRDFARLAFDQGWLRLWFLEVEGTPVAGWLGFRFAGVESYYQAGRDPAWDSWSVGWLLLVQTVREALSDGVQEYRFLRGGEAFKYRLANDDRRLETVAVSSGSIGAAAVRSASFLRKKRFAPVARWYRSL